MRGVVDRLRWWLLAALGMVLAGFLVLLVGLVVTLPLAACTLTAAYEQLFGPEDRGRLTGS